jgi:hypothetical protein
MDFDLRNLGLQHGVGGEAVSGAGSDLLITGMSGRSRNALKAEEIEARISEGSASSSTGEISWKP